MGLSAAAWAAIASTTASGVSMISANQRNQDAKGEAGKALANAPNPLLDAAKAAEQGNNEYNRKKKMLSGAVGFGSTILTGPSGLQTPNTGMTRSTLLGA